MVQLAKIQTIFYVNTNHKIGLDGKLVDRRLSEA